MTRESRAERARDRSEGARRLAWLAAALVAPLVVGCAGSSVQHTVGGWFDRARTVTEESRPRYAAASRVHVHRAPDESSEVVGALRLHERVLAYQVESGFAYIRAEQSGSAGWVRERYLIERIPVERKPPADAVSQPEGEQPPDQPEAVSEPEGAPDSGAPPPPDKSIFDPY